HTHTHAHTHTHTPVHTQVSLQCIDTQQAINAHLCSRAVHPQRHSTQNTHTHTHTSPHAGHSAEFRNTPGLKCSPLSSGGQPTMKLRTEQKQKYMFSLLSSLFPFFHSMFLVNPAYPHVLKQ